MADASDELSRSAHAFGTSVLDESEIQFELQQFHNRMHALFTSGHCLETPGYTSFAIAMLKDLRVSMRTNGLQPFGGLGEALPRTPSALLGTDDHVDLSIQRGSCL